MLRESAWKKEQSILEQDANNISILKKEISQIDASVQLSINQKIDNLKLNATILAKKLQNEKHKNAELETIIAHLKNIIQKQKIEEASFRESSNFQNISGLDNRYKKLEYDLGQLNGKTNRITQNVDDKRGKINQNRTERVIDSGIFRNIEKELIQSQLKFKKLLIQKIKYQKEYEKLLKSYQGLKGQAQSYSEQHDNKLKSGKTQTSLIEQSKINAAKKFTNLEVNRDPINAKPRTLTQIEDQNEYEQQKQMITIRKILSETGVESCEELVFNFFHIEEVNDKYFNQMTVYSDQSNQIEKYLAEFKQKRSQNKLKFYQTKKVLTKNQALKNEATTLNSLINSTSQETKIEMNQIADFFKENNFKKFLEAFELKEYHLTQGESHFDELTDILQDLQSHMNQILSKQSLVRQQKTSTTSRSNQHQKLQELISRVRKPEENLKIMMKKQFQDQYHKILKTSASKTAVVKHPLKRNSTSKLPK